MGVEGLEQGSCGLREPFPAIAAEFIKKEPGSQPGRKVGKNSYGVTNTMAIEAAYSTKQESRP